MFKNKKKKKFSMKSLHLLTANIVNMLCAH